MRWTAQCGETVLHSTAPQHHPPAFLTKLRHHAVPSVHGGRPPCAGKNDAKKRLQPRGYPMLSHAQSPVMHAALDLECTPTFRIVPMASLLTIAEVAKRTGLTAHTLRYYERAGLIAPVARAPGGQRRYAASDMEWIGFLLRLRETQ
eukprot:gene15489-19614_t